MSNFNITIENHIIANNVLTLGTVNEPVISSLLSEMMRQSTDDRHQFTPDMTPVLTSTLTDLEEVLNTVKNKDLAQDLVDTFTINSVEFTVIPEGSNYESDTCQNAMDDTWTAIIFLNTYADVHGIVLHDYVLPGTLDSHRPTSGSFIIVPGQTRYQHVFNNTENIIAYLTVRFKSSYKIPTGVNPLVGNSEIDAFIEAFLKDM